VDRDEPELVAIHRLDRITAGLLVLSRRRETRGTYQRLFQDRRITKTYRAIAGYRPDLPLPLCRSSRLQKTPGTRPVVEVPGRANAYTEIALLRRLPGGSGPDEPGTERAEYRLMPHTGKTHQLRVHLNALGIPIAGDPLYPVDRHEEPEDYSSPLQLLAEELAFTDPLTGRPRRFRSGLRLGAAT
jgi:tRNA pseudouridine32 synthase/23S rRNA pseudouridine746 synthase